MLFSLKNSRYFYSLNETKEFVTKSLQNYYGLEKKDTLEEYELIRYKNKDDEIEILPVSLDIYYRKDSARNHFKDMHYTLTLEDKGPFELSNVDFQDFISNITVKPFVQSPPKRPRFVRFW